MYFNNMDEKIIYNNNLSTLLENYEFFDITMTGVTYPSDKYDVTYNGAFRKNSERYYVFEYVASGSGFIEMNGEKIKVTAGDFYYYHKDSVLSYYPDPADPYKKLWANVRGSLVDSLVENFRLGQFIKKQVYCEDIFIELHRLFEAVEGDPQPNVLRSAARLIYKLIDLAADETKLFGSAKQVSTAERIRGFLDSHMMMRNLTLGEVAAANYISEMHCIRLFSEKYGMTPMAYLRKQRLAEARTLLGTASLSVREIADILGYSDRRHFSACFKREFGVTPSEYQRSIGAGQNTPDSADAD